MISLTDLVADLPPEPVEAQLFPAIQQEVAQSGRTLVVLDDDPTGTQTVHNVQLFMTWSEQTLLSSIEQRPDLFFLLTNSRSLPEQAAFQLNEEAALQLIAVSHTTQRDIVFASRSDSTLRGHYPAEIHALEHGLQRAAGAPLDGHLLIPAFFEGGRYTIEDTHYVATPTASSPTLQLASETPFAQDRAFGYSTSYLPAWVEEKSHGFWKANQVMSIGLDTIRREGPDGVAARLSSVRGGVPVIINAVGYGDLAVVVLGVPRAEKAGKRFAYRTAASFVRLRGAVTSRPLLQARDIIGHQPEQA